MASDLALEPEVLRIEYLPLEEIRPDPQNPKDHDLGLLAESFERFGFISPGAINEETGFLIYGHGRLKSLLQRKASGQDPPRGILVDDDGRWLMPIIRGIRLSEIEGQAYVLTDNYSSERGGWDETQRTDNLIFLAKQNALAGTGFDGDDVDRFIRLHRPELLPEIPEPDFDRGEQLKKAWRTKPRQLWQIGPHRLLCGDATDKRSVEALFDGEKADAIVTDPPYGIERQGVYNDDPQVLLPLLQNAFEYAPMDDGVLASFFSPRTVPILLEALSRAEYKFERLLWLYQKDGNQAIYPWRGWTLVSHAIVLASRGKPPWPKQKDYRHDTYMKTTGEDDELTGLHTTIKPAWIVEDLVRRLPRGLVYEPFAGSGTTIVSVHLARGRCYAVEIDPVYCAVALQRLEDLGLKPTLVTR